MKKNTTRNGFTLVELAIVMMIIGFLIGGVLKGQELMQNARVTATIAQIKAFEAATTTFRDKYDALPGDMTNAALRIPGCNAAVACNPVAAATAGNSIVGNITWNPAGADWTTQTNAAQALLASVNGETVLFWLHLMASDLITGVTNRALSAPPNGTPLWGETHPTAKIGGGFIIGWGNGNRPPGAPVGVVGPSGLLTVIAGAPAGNLTTAAGVQPMPPSRAAQIDRKMDDGISSLGSVMSYGPTASCFTGGTAANSYNETISANDCGLIIRLGQ